MCQVIVPASRVPSPSRVPTESEIQRLSAAAEQNRFPRNYAPGLLDGDVGFGHNGAAGGAGASGQFAQVQPPLNPPPQDTLYGSLDYVLTQAQGLNWAEQGTPPNPNILAAYQVCGNGNYTRDGSAMMYAWCAAFVSWALDTAGIENLRSMSSQAYNSYGRAVQWRNLENIRKNDIVVFKSKTRGGGHVGFIQGVDPERRTVACLGGNQSNNLNVRNYQFDSNSQYIKEIRRNWDIPAEFDVPLVRSLSGEVASGSATV